MQVTQFVNEITDELLMTRRQQCCLEQRCRNFEWGSRWTKGGMEEKIEQKILRQNFRLKVRYKIETLKFGKCMITKAN